jgi:hypothetical protein
MAMARPVKAGCDYFPMDCNVDSKMKLVKYRHGVAGYGLLISLIQWIYSQGYFAKFGEDEKIIFAGENGVNYDFVCELVDFCVSKDIFDHSIYSEHSVLTSSGIQKRYAGITEKRRKVLLNPDFLLVDAALFKNGVINGIDSGNNAIDSGNNSQSKVKETKVKESKGDEVDTPESPSGFFDAIEKINCENPDITVAVNCVYLSNESFKGVHRMHIEQSLFGQPDRAKWHDAILGLASKYAGVKIEFPNRTLQNWLKGKHPTLDKDNINLDEL